MRSLSLLWVDREIRSCVLSELERKVTSTERAIGLN
jgi:hypothetical protein